jgi:hypothetical protein
MTGWQDALDRRHSEGLVWARWAVRRWDLFPVERRPRPLVLAGHRAFVERGFRTGAAKLAYLEGRTEFAVPVPDEVVRELPLRREMGPRRIDAWPLLIRSAVRAETEFVTDRGRRRLPAWRLEAADALGPIWVLDPDVDPPEWLPPEPPPTPRPDLTPPLADPGARAVLASDGITLTVDQLGGPPEYERYVRGDVVESPQAVTVVPIGVDVGPPGARRAIGYIHQITVRLTEPLGARVYVDLHGNAGCVTGAGD